MHALFNQFRERLHPPYTKKTYITLAITLLIIIIVPVVVIFSRQQTNRSSYAASLVPTEVASSETGVAIGRQLFPPQAALVANGAPSVPGEKHGLGLLDSPLHHSHMVPANPSETGTTNPNVQGASITNLPGSIDLSQYAPAVGNQGGINSCVAWSEDYYLRGWYAKRDGYYPAGGNYNTGSFEPMYTYSQVVGGQNAGTTFDQHVNIMETQGVDTRADYTQGDYDYIDLPTSAEKANASNYKISSWQYLPSSTSTQPTQTQLSIETALASGNPVSMGLPVYQNFYDANATNYYIDVPPPGSTWIGNHAVTAFKYDQNGVWVVNQWGTGWGLNGWAELSWNFINTLGWNPVEIVPVTPGNITVPPTPNISSTPTPVTATPTLFPTPTIYISPTPTATPAPDDGIAPVVTITSPLNGTLVKRNSKQTVTFTATDDTAIVVNLSINGSVTSTCQATTASSYQCSWTTNGKVGASYTLKVSATDAAQHTSSQSVSVKSAK